MQAWCLRGKKIALAKQVRRKEGWINYPLQLCAFARKNPPRRTRQVRKMQRRVDLFSFAALRLCESLIKNKR
jgi:hypothetical protein